MNKKLTAILLVAMVMVGVFAGCGSEGSGIGKTDTMTLTEMCQAVIEDNGGSVLVYRSGSEDKPSVYGTPIRYDDKGNANEMYHNKYDSIETITKYSEELKVLERTIINWKNTDKFFNDFYECTREDFDGVTVLHFKQYFTGQYDGKQHTEHYYIVETESIKGKTIVNDEDTESDVAD